MSPEPSSSSNPEPTGTDAHRQKPAPAPTPFDNPWLLPILLIGFALWFSYDGWLNPNIKSIWFNRICAPIAAMAALWSGRGALRENKARREAEERSRTERVSNPELRGPEAR
jgi:hypothetical protein